MNNEALGLNEESEDARRPNRDEVLAVIKDILTTLEKSSIVPQGVTDKIRQFWTRYKTAAEEYDAEFLQRYREDMDTSMMSFVAREP
ncbi:hypothetical protein EIP91_001787 [Steccherinum ochraceum]|uniref:Uncharacterized protein n=1 Tax=Steccherinum ochraceum TaxID=92696 RepID=A0A4R0S0Y0_9APHY|nr:hypothetical protein EIP91_001787 [Steccherinum ochraceum]